jgi:hypothetical protein
MRSYTTKRGKFAAGILTAALSASLITPASAIVPPDAPAGSQDYVSNGKSSMIFGSGSDTTYPLHQDLATIFNRAPGCITQTKAISAGGSEQLFDMACNPLINANIDQKPGFANYDRDLASEYYFIGSGGGRSHVSRWNQGTANAVQADYFRSSSSGVSAPDQRSIAYAADALGTFVFDSIPLSDNSTVTPANEAGRVITELRKKQVSDIYQGNIKCWASINRAVSDLAGVAAGTDAAYVTSGKFDEVKWLALAKAAAAAGTYNSSSDVYKACVQIAVYTVPQTSGTAQAWNQLAAGGSSSSVKSEDFLLKEDPFTGAPFTAAEKLSRSIAENNASQIANRLSEAGINKDRVRNALYFYSIGKYTTALGGLVGGNPQLSGNSTKLTGFTDRLLKARADAPATGTDAAAVEATATTIANRTYLYARQLFFGYQYPNQATRNYMDPVNGFLCSTKTDGMRDPINSFDVRDQIENAMLDAGFFPLGTGEAISGKTGNTSYCRQAAVADTDAGTDKTAPTVGYTVNASSAGASATKPIFTLTFSELVSGVNASTVGIREVNAAGAPVGGNVASTIVCSNARLAVIPCLAKTSATNYDLSPLEFVKTVTVQPNAALAPGKSYQAFAVGQSGSTVEIQDRRGLADWPIVTGNGLVNANSATFAVAKNKQVAPKVGTKLVAKKTLNIKRTTDKGLNMTAKSGTPKICTVKTVKTNLVVTGVRAGTCKITLSQAGNTATSPLANTVKTIKVTTR